MQRPLPEALRGCGTSLRRLTVDDAPALAEAVAASIEHLRPWMAWVALEPVAVRQRRALLAQWRRGWPRTGEAVFVEEALAGTCGLRPRGRETLEIGYWIQADFLRRGLAASASRLLTDLAFTWPDVRAVEIRHDKANAASAGVPRTLGYRLIAETPDARLTPGEVGIDCIWRVEREEWS
jgi:ribosomal-protein-serine acetyltransferase